MVQLESDGTYLTQVHLRCDEDPVISRGRPCKNSTQFLTRCTTKVCCQEGEDRLAQETVSHRLLVMAGTAMHNGSRRLFTAPKKQKKTRRAAATCESDDGESTDSVSETEHTEASGSTLPSDEALEVAWMDCDDPADKQIVLHNESLSRSLGCLQSYGHEVHEKRRESQIPDTSSTFELSQVPIGAMEFSNLKNCVPGGSISGWAHHKPFLIASVAVVKSEDKGDWVQDVDSDVRYYVVVVNRDEVQTAWDTCGILETILTQEQPGAVLDRENIRIMGSGFTMGWGAMLVKSLHDEMYDLCREKIDAFHDFMSTIAKQSIVPIPQWAEDAPGIEGKALQCLAIACGQTMHCWSKASDPIASEAIDVFVTKASDFFKGHFSDVMQDVDEVDSKVLEAAVGEAMMQVYGWLSDKKMLQGLHAAGLPSSTELRCTSQHHANCRVYSAILNHDISMARNKADITHSVSEEGGDKAFYKQVRLLLDVAQVTGEDRKVAVKKLQDAMRSKKFLEECGLSLDALAEVLDRDEDGTGEIRRQDVLLRYAEGFLHKKWADEEEKKRAEAKRIEVQESSKSYARLSRDLRKRKGAVNYNEKHLSDQQKRTKT